MKDFDFVLVLFLSALWHKQDLIWGKVISQPSIQYVYKNDSTMLNCLNATENGTFINYIKRSVWYRVLSNGSNLITARYGDSGTIFVHMYALVFNAVKETDQGQYKCCTTADETSCSVPTTVSIAENPIVKVSSTDYTAFIGSNITLACKIIYVGKPPAKFRWRRNGQYVSNDFVYNNSTHTLLILINLVEEDSGLYRCVSDAVLSLHTYSIYLHLQVLPKLMVYGPNLVISGTMVHINCTQLEGRPSADIHITTPQGTVIPDSQTVFNATVNDTGNYTCTANTSLITITEEHYLLVYDVDNTTSFLIFLVILRNGDCDPIKELVYAKNISVALEKYIYHQVCKCNVSVFPLMFTCNSNTKAVYSIQITGYRARNVQQYLYSYHLTKQLDLQIATLYVCDQFCEQTDDVVVTASNDNAITTSAYSDDHTVAISLASCALALLVIAILSVLMYSTSRRIRKHHSCIPREETSMPQRHSQELIPGVTNPANTDYETNSFPNAEIESEITYTNNPTYESLPDSGMLHESPLAAQYIVPVEAKRNEEYPRNDITRNVDTLHAYLDGSRQNTSLLPIANNLNTDQDTAKYLGTHTNLPDHRKEVNMYDEATAICHQPVQTAKTNTNQCNNQITTQAATRNVPMHMARPSLLSHKTFAKILNTNPCETDV